MNELLLRTRRVGNQTRVLVIGPLDHRTAHTLHQQLNTLIQAHDTTPEIIADLTCCTHADHHGLKALDEASAAARSAGKVLHLDAVPPLIDDLLRRHRRQV